VLLYGLSTDLVQVDRTAAEGPKRACAFFQKAAGAYEYASRSSLLARGHELLALCTFLKLSYSVLP
jgi:hypothetical protein